MKFIGTGIENKSHLVPEHPAVNKNINLIKMFSVEKEDQDPDEGNRNRCWRVGIRLH